VAHRGGSCRHVSTWTESCCIAISAEAAASICVQRGAGKPVAVYRKRALAVESGPPGKVRYCRPAAAEARRSTKVRTTKVRAAKMRPATAEMGRSAHMHAAAAEVSSAAHPMGDAASTAVKSTACAMESAATAATVESTATTATVKSTATTATAAASSGACGSGARESGRQDNNAENLDF
jgi:hypothetical protein